MQTTPCECSAAGWCPRHACEKSFHDWQMCRRRMDYFTFWESGERFPNQAPASTPPRLDCRFRGEERRQIACPACARGGRLRVFACALHEECVLRGSVDAVRSCATCGDFEPRSVTAAPAPPSP